MAKRKMIIRSRRSKKDRQYNGQKKTDHHFWPLYCLSFDDLRLLMIIFLLAIVLSVLLWSMTSDDHFSFDHCIVCPSLIYDFWWSLFFWPLYCLSFFDLPLLMITFLLTIVLSVLLRSTTSDDHFSFGHCKVDRRSTDNTMAKRKMIIRSRRSKKDRQYNGQKKSDHQKS
jgi:hypothetical protein